MPIGIDLSTMPMGSFEIPRKQKTEKKEEPEAEVPFTPKPKPSSL
jgi:hypothetical protein